MNSLKWTTNLILFSMDKTFIRNSRVVGNKVWKSAVSDQDCRSFVLANSGPVFLSLIIFLSFDLTWSTISLQNWSSPTRQLRRYQRRSYWDWIRHWSYHWRIARIPRRGLFGHVEQQIQWWSFMARCCLSFQVWFFFFSCWAIGRFKFQNLY